MRLQKLFYMVCREKAALAEQVLQKSLELQQAKAGVSVSAETSEASDQVMLRIPMKSKHRNVQQKRVLRGCV